MILPREAIPLITALAPAFNRPTYRRFVPLLLAAVLTTGRRTVAGHPGKRVYGKARHRDAVRSTHSHTTCRYGVSVRWTASSMRTACVG